MTNLSTTVPVRPCRTVWASPDQRNAAISALIQNLLIDLPGLSAATQALSLTGTAPKAANQERRGQEPRAEEPWGHEP
jgi:hypothetical protein